MASLRAKDKADYESGRRLYAVGIGFVIASMLCVIMFLLFEYIEQTYSPRGFSYVIARVKTSDVDIIDGSYKASYTYEYLVPRYYLFTSKKEKSFNSEEDARNWLSAHKIGDDMKVSYNVIVPEYTTIGSVSIKPNIINYIAPVGFITFALVGIIICREARRILKNNSEFKE